MVRHCLFLTVEDEAVIQEGLVNTVECSLEDLCIDYGLLDSRNSDGINGSLNILIGMFRWIGLAANIAKSKTIKLYPGEIRSEMSEEMFGRNSIGKGAT